jgi:DNA-directed RNA polymerase subunit RPC12/RpoP
MLKKDLIKRNKELEDELERVKKSLSYLKHSFFDMYVDCKDTSLTYRLKGKEYECVFCDVEIEGYGNNSEPIKKGRCCNDCNSKLVIPFRLLSFKNKK